MRQAVVARSFCAGRSHGIASRRFLPGSRNAPLASLPQCFLPGSRNAPLASLSQRLLLGSRNAPLAGLTPCALQSFRRNSARRQRRFRSRARLGKAPLEGYGRKPEFDPETGAIAENRSVPSRKRSNRTKNPAFGLENRSRLSQRTGRARIGGHPRQDRRTSAPGSEDQPHLIAKTPTWRTSKPQFGSRICILGVAGLPYNL